MKLKKQNAKNYEININAVFNVENMQEREKAENLLLMFGNLEQLVNFAKEVNEANVPKLEMQILNNIISGKVESNDLTYVLDYAKSVKNANVKNIEEMLVQFIKNGLITKDNFHFVCEITQNIQGMEVFRIEDEVIKMNSYPYLLAFATEVKNANISKLNKAVIRIGNKAEIEDFRYKFLRDLEM